MASPEISPRDRLTWSRQRDAAASGSSLALATPQSSAYGTPSQSGGRMVSLEICGLGIRRALGPQSLCCTKTANPRAPGAPPVIGSPSGCRHRPFQWIRPRRLPACCPSALGGIASPPPWLCGWSPDLGGRPSCCSLPGGSWRSGHFGPSPAPSKCCRAVICTPEPCLVWHATGCSAWEGHLRSRRCPVPGASCAPLLQHPLPPSQR